MASGQRYGMVVPSVPGMYLLTIIPAIGIILHELSVEPLKNFANNMKLYPREMIIS